MFGKGFKYIVYPYRLLVPLLTKVKLWISSELAFYPLLGCSASIAEPDEPDDKLVADEDSREAISGNDHEPENDSEPVSLSTMPFIIISPSLSVLSVNWNINKIVIALFRTQSIPLQLLFATLCWSPPKAHPKPAQSAKPAQSYPNHRQAQVNISSY